ncbi:T9SS type B sorting domain-containing protein [uncultured Algibacter sp.]|uniref:T9SS type B sorting domain-containing protein n=1 Tax=uncultured Algibacter sp. TaxID=298659 RepID=UPI00261BE060|nr:T9SS type B sorting domain-containing protein [uncultured Algibacter sp.]
MFKTWLFLIGIILISSKTFCQNTAIPDSNFEQALIDEGLDTPPLNGQVPTSNISGITDLDVKGKSIQDLTGIEDFLALQNLDCSENQITSLTTSTLSNLRILWCFNNRITNLNIEANTELTALRCENNTISSLNLLNNTNLVDLTCENNSITNLNVTSNLSLSRFQCDNNLLSSLDVSYNSNLSYLSCSGNQIQNLNVINNISLKVLLCSNNQISTLNISQNSTLTDLNCSSNILCQLLINNGNNNNMTDLDFSNNADLNCVVVDDANGNHSTWLPSGFSNYVNSNEDCSTFIPVDVLDDFIGRTYILPIISHGHYYTEPKGNGTQLNIGETITNSQTIYIYNEINCYSNESNFNVIITDNDYFIPKFFTPNNDGFNDAWVVFDYDHSINNVSIFNRNGKLLKFLSGASLKWDGTYNGAQMNTDTYWYEIVLNTGEVLRGYFALKR